MREFMYNRLAEMHVHVGHSHALLIAGIVVGLWVFASLPAALLIGRAMRRLGHKGGLPPEIVKAPRDRTVIPTPGRVA